MQKTNCKLAFDSRSLSVSQPPTAYVFSLFNFAYPLFCFCLRRLQPGQSSFTRISFFQSHPAPMFKHTALTNSTIKFLAACLFILLAVVDCRGAIFYFSVGQYALVSIPTTDCAVTRSLKQLMWLWLGWFVSATRCLLRLLVQRKTLPVWGMED